MSDPAAKETRATAERFQRFNFEELIFIVTFLRKSLGPRRGPISPEPEPGIYVTDPCCFKGPKSVGVIITARGPIVRNPN